MRKNPRKMLCENRCDNFLSDISTSLVIIAFSKKKYDHTN